MSSETYELLALTARYWFIIAAGLILVRSWWAGVRDNRNAQYRRSWRGGSGYIGEMVVTGDHGKRGKSSLKGARFPVPQGGMLGSGKMADMRIRHSDVRGRHVWMEFSDGMLRLTPVGKHKISSPRLPDGTYVMKNGDRLIIGGLQMALTLYEPQEPLQNKRGRMVRGAKTEQDFDDEDFWE